ncbi:hypothetical protein ACFFMR_09095 [Micromonospora andamanensis]|uniref:hypothetical protein n=1 Tax=Micromonospora andamanensis TaxID=1287068 RepID=UPI001952159E|nr:hypothetical protein [Micromonospora andamanensis]
MAVPRLSALAAGGGVFSVLALAGWPAVVVLLAAAAMTTALLGWVVNDRERPERLALIIRAIRQQPTRTGRSRSVR